MTDRSAAFLALLVVVVPGVLVLRFAAPSRLLVWEVFVILLSWGALQVRGRSWGDVGLRAPESWRHTVLLAMIGAGVLLVTSLALRLAVNKMLGWSTDAAAFEVLRGDPWALALGLAIAWLVGAVGEELLYRGFLLDTVRSVLPPRFGGSGAGWWLALGAVSVMFGLAHGFQGRGAIVIATMISFGYGTIMQLGGRNLWPAILTHGVYDTVAFVLVFSGVRIGA